jgi:hypothetical protein
MEHTYLIYVGIFGCAVAAYLWMRDARIFYRTALPGYRKAAYYGVAYTALSITGVLFMLSFMELLGLGMILLALYLQSAIVRERDRIWSSDSSTLDRALGKATLQKADRKSETADSADESEIRLSRHERKMKERAGKDKETKDAEDKDTET